MADICPVYKSDCLGADCAWWSTEMGMCDPTGLIPWLKHIENHLAKIANQHGHTIKKVKEG